MAHAAPTVPQTPAEYRAWWEENTPVPYGYCWCGCGSAPRTAKQSVRREGVVRGEPKRYLPNHHARVRTPQERKLNAENRAEISRRYLGGEPPSEIAAAMGIDKSTVYRVLKKRGVSPNRRLSEADQAEICRRYQDGETTYALGRAFRVSDGAIGNVLRKHGVIRRSGSEAHAVRWPLADAQELEACRRYQGGETAKAIARHFGVSTQVVLKALDRRGIPRNVRTVYASVRQHHAAMRILSDAQEAEVVRLYQTGESIPALAKALSVGEGAVDGALERNSVEKRPGVAGERLSLETEAEVCRRYLAGDKPKVISEALGIGRSTISFVLKRNGVWPQHKLRYTEEQQAEALRRYMRGDSVEAISQALGISPSGVYPVLRRAGIEPRRNAERMAWASEPEKTVICQRYAAGESARALACEFGVSEGTVGNLLAERGVKKRSASEAHRRHSCDHGFFDVIDSEAKAYWLGFIAADGCVMENGVLSIGLSSIDHDHLLRFKADVRSSHPVRRYKVWSKPPGSSRAQARFVSTISISSPQLCAGLVAHGVPPRKTFILEWPGHLRPDLLRDVLRGYTDGDGTLCASQSNYVRKSDGECAVAMSWQIVGTEAFCNGAQRYLMESVGVNETKIRPHPESPGIATLSYGGNRQVSRIYHLLYEDAVVFLPRKRDVVRPHVLTKERAAKGKSRYERAEAYKNAWRRAMPHIPYGFCWCGCGQRTSIAKRTGTAAGRVEGEPIRYLLHHFQRSLPESLEGEVCRRYRAGESSVALAKVFGVGPTAILGALRRNGIDIRPSAASEPLAPEQEAEICRRYAAGEKPKALAEAFGISQSGVLKILERSGVPRRYWKAISPERQAEICRRYLMGDKITDIATDAGINLTSIYGVLKRNGIKARRQRQASLSE